MTKLAKQRFFALLKVSLLGLAFPLVVTNQTWVQAGTIQDTYLKYAQAPAKPTPEPKQSTTPQLSPSPDAKQTSESEREKKQEESDKSDKEKQKEPSLIVLQDLRKDTRYGVGSNKLHTNRRMFEFLNQVLRKPLVFQLINGLRGQDR